MNFIKTKNALKTHPVFSIKTIKMIEPSFDSKNLVYWQKKEQVGKIINRWYYFKDIEISEKLLYFTSCQIYSPSYISLETALSYYQIIPEGVYSITAISTKKTMEFNTTLGTFLYRHVKPNLFFGYQLIEFKSSTFKMAELEKTLLDYLYLNDKTNTLDAFENLRWNRALLKEKLNIKKIHSYLKIYQNRSLEKRVDTLLQFIEHA